MFRRSLAMSLGCMVAVATMFGGGALAAMHGQVVTREKVAGKYKLVLRIGSPEVMSMKSGMGEMMLGGRHATCNDNKSHMGGMSMGSHMCNHHVELHVYNKRTGMVVSGARVSISMLDARKHMTIRVPIMAMTGSGMKDYHYGNNIFAGSGTYTVIVTVNGTRTSFSVLLM